jgi:hypothetical protein
MSFTFEAVSQQYGQVSRGNEKALHIICGKSDDSYEIVSTYQDELLKSMSCCVVEYDTEENKGNVCFKRFFVPLKPCIDGFLQGRKPYIAIDVTHLTGRSRG